MFQSNTDGEKRFYEFSLKNSSGFRKIQVKGHRYLVRKKEEKRQEKNEKIVGRDKRAVQQSQFPMVHSRPNSKMKKDLFRIKLM